MEHYRYLAGNLPVLISVPHAGTLVPEEIASRFTKQSKTLPDTDWHVDRLYGFARKLGVHMLIAPVSRYVVDLNRAPDDASLYPGKFTTGLCPRTLFNGWPVYRTGAEPDQEEVKQRVETYWRPYHDKLREVLAALKAGHPRVVLFDAHSIASKVPNLFDGTLFELNFGTADGASADIGLAESLFAIGKASPYSVVLNGRFKGGYITRNYGKPAEGIHAIQLELAQRTYMEEAHPYGYIDEKVAALQETLKPIVERMIGWSRNG